MTSRCQEALLKVGEVKDAMSLPVEDPLHTALEANPYGNTRSL
jgi:hypothetical protein